MKKRAVELALTAVLVAASLEHVCCDRLRVKLGYTAPATLTSASQASGTASRRHRVVLAYPGFSSSASSGDPALPCKMIYVALPPDADERTVRIVPRSYSTAEMTGSYEISPVPAAATSGGHEHWGAEKRLVGGQNQRTYGRNAFYPLQQIRIASVGRLRTWKIAALEFWPYAYNPVSGRLRRVRSEEAELSFARTPRNEAAVADSAASVMSGFVSNDKEAMAWYPGAPSSAAVKPGYAIITTNALRASSNIMDGFAACLASRGFAVNIVTEDAWGGGRGDVAAERIRAWLKSNYLRLGLQYALLIGNPNPALGDVPMKMLWPRRWSSSFPDAPSDYYYADLTGNWDRDGDGYAGEEPDDFGPGGIDRIPEIYVGRIPYYGNITQLDWILRKTILYKTIDCSDWGRTCLMAMKPMDSGTPSYQLGDQIARDLLPQLEISPNRISDGIYPGSTPENHPCTYDSVLEQWLRGAGLVLWMTHGTYNTASNVFISSRCAYLDDTRPSIVYMASCSNGQPENAGNLGYCVLAKGGVSTLSASRVSWYYVGETDFRSSDSIGGIGYQYAKCLSVEMKPCGRAAADARLCHPVSIWPNHLVFNLFGDPSVVYDPRRTTAAARRANNGAMVTIDHCIVSRIGEPGECYVEDVSRCAGIRVCGRWGDAPGFGVGTRVRVSGRMTTELGMQAITEAQVTPLASQPSPSGPRADVKPLSVNNRSACDARVLGLLVTVWGRVVSNSQGGMVISDGTTDSGLKVSCRCVVSIEPGSHVVVTGISTPSGVVAYSGADLTVYEE